MAKYVGKRVVPRHCGAWTKNKEYEMLSIVLDETSGESYISRRVVPAGTLLTDEYYWSICSLFSQQIADMGEEFEERQNQISQNNATTLAAIRQDNDATEQAIRDDNDATEQAVREDNANTKSYVDQVTDEALADMNQAKQSFDQTSISLTTRMNSIAGAATDDTEILDARVDYKGTTYENLGEHLRGLATGLIEMVSDTMTKANYLSLTDAATPEIAIEGYYLGGNYRPVVYEPFSITDSIPVKAGDIIVVNLTSNSGVMIVSYYNPDTDTYSDGLRGDPAKTEYEYFASKDGYLRLCFMTSRGCTYRVISSRSLAIAYQDISSLKDDNENSMKLLMLMGYSKEEKQIAEVGVEGKYVNINGNIASYVGCYMTKPISVRKGDYIMAHIWRNGSCSQIAYCSEDGSGPYVPAVKENYADVGMISDRDGYVVFSTNVGLECPYQIIHSDTLRLFFSGWEDILSTLDEHLDKLDTLQPIADHLSVERSKNLFDKNAIINGYYVTSGPGTLSSHEDAAVSALIPVEAGKAYTVQRSEGSLGASELRFVAEDRITPLKGYDADGNERSSYMGTKNMTVIAPEGAAFCQFTVKFRGNAADYDRIQFEEGTEKTSYVDYLYRPYVDYGALPPKMEGLVEKVDTVMEASGKIKTGINYDVIDIASSGKIGFFSNSFLNGYTMRTHHALDNLGMWSDYIMYNYGKSGDDALECLARINANQKFFGSVPVQDWGITYGVIAMQDNDGALFAADRETYRENFKKIAEAIRAMGAIPILATEHDQTENYYGLMALAQEEGYLFMDWGRLATTLGRFVPFWNSGHPATRTAWLWSNGMKPYLDTLPRPEKGIKLFRKRPDTLEDDLIFNNVYERAERFVEIDNGYSCLTADGAKYFDRLNNGLATYEYLQDEYQKLQSQTESVSFGSYALIDCITPYAGRNLTGMVMHLVVTGVEKAYIKKNLSLENSLPANRYVAFGVTKGAEKLEPGTAFSITEGVFNDNIKGDYVVAEIINGMVITTTGSNNKTTSGTDKPVCSIDGVELAGSYDYPSAEYMKRFDKPLGEWIEIELSAATDLSPYLKTCMDYDKVSILLKGTDIVISDISFVVEGKSKKLTSGKKFVKYRKGESLITDILLDDGTAWIGIDQVRKYLPVISTLDSTKTEPLPAEITTVREIEAGESIQQLYNYDLLGKDSYHTDHLQIRVLARYFPEYIDTDEKWEHSEIKEGSYDCAKMSIILDGATKCARTPVGAFWNEYIFDVDFQNRSRNGMLTIQCDDKSLQIAKVEMVLVKD